MKTKPVSIPPMAASLVVFFEKIPMNKTGKSVDAANPNAKATTCATNAGGKIPRRPARRIVIPAANLAYKSSFFSVIWGIKVCFIKS